MADAEKVVPTIVHQEPIDQPIFRSYLEWNPWGMPEEIWRDLSEGASLRRARYVLESDPEATIDGLAHDMALSKDEVKILKRPSHTPDGFEFPYSSFGDPEKRIKLLRDIAETLDLKPETVLNMGCGYDITPSDAFPDARVIHVDLAMPEYVEKAPDYVGFLRANGFEAYTSDELPEDFSADLALDILGPGVDPEQINKGGILISTSHYVHSGMEIVMLVVDESEDGAIEPIFRSITDPDEIRRVDQSGSPRMHLIVTKKVREE